MKMARLLGLFVLLFEATASAQDNTPPPFPAPGRHPLGDMPLVVMTRGIPDETGPDAKTLEEDHQQDQASMIRLSRNGKQVIAAHSGHHIQLDEPEFVIQTVHDVIFSICK